MITQSNQESENLASAIYLMDAACRNDFNFNNIVSERDYVSIFLNYIRHPYGPLNNTFFAHAQTLPSNMEQGLGCDGIIIFRGQNGIKIGLFEAKVIKTYWDSTTGRPRISRFQRQLNKQVLINPRIAVWEIFINKDINEQYFDALGSTCVKLDEVRNYVIANRTWRLQDLYSVCNTSYLNNNSVPVNIKQIVNEILNCKFGTLINPNINEVKLFNENSEIMIPIISEKVTPEEVNKINIFLEQSNICNYIYVDVTSYMRERIDQAINSILT